MADNDAHCMCKTMKGVRVLAVLLTVLPAVLGCTAVPASPAAPTGASPLATPVAGGCRYDEAEGAVSCEQRWWGEDCSSELVEPGKSVFVAEAWVDADENGKWDEGEPPLPGARLNISVWGFAPCANNYFIVDSCSPEGVEIPRGLGDSDLWLLMSDRCKWQEGLTAATDSQGRMIIAIETDTALGYAFTPLAPAGYRAPLQPSSGIRYGFIPIASAQSEGVLTPTPPPALSDSTAED